MTVVVDDARWITSTVFKSLLLIVAAQLLAACAVRPTEEAAPPPIGGGSSERNQFVPPGGRVRADALGDETILLQSSAYEVLYSETKRNPLVVSYYLRPQAESDPKPCDRPSTFLRDDRTRSRVTDRAFRNTGYDKGHLAPNAPIAKRFGCGPQRETFLLTNITPQLPGLNQRTWASFEAVTDTVYANAFDGVWVMTGPVFDPTHIVTLCKTSIEVPIAFWKIVVRRIGKHGIDALAVVMSQQERSDKPIETFTTTVDDIEARTGIDFFADLPGLTEAALESHCPENAWRQQQRLTPPNEGWGTPRATCVSPAVPRSRSLGTHTAASLACPHHATAPSSSVEFNGSVQ